MKYISDVNPSENNHQHNVKKVEITIDVLTPEQKSLHNNFKAAAKVLKVNLLRSIYFLAAVHHQKVHRLLGFRTISEYASEVAEFTPSQTKAFLNLARRLPEFQEVERAVARGELTWIKALEICRHTDPADQKTWLDKASRLGVRALKERLKRPEKPTPSPSPGQRQLPISDTRKEEPPGTEFHHLTLRFTTEQLARWQSCLEGLMKAGHGPKEEMILDGLAALMQNKITTNRNSGPYLLTILYDTGKATIPTNRGELPAPRALLEAASCDGIIEDEDGRRRATIPPRIRRQALAQARYRCQAPGCSRTMFLEVHHRRQTSQGGGDRQENLIVLCSRCHRKIHQAEERASQVKRLAPDGVLY